MELPGIGHSLGEIGRIVSTDLDDGRATVDIEFGFPAEGAHPEPDQRVDRPDRRVRSLQDQDAGPIHVAFTYRPGHLKGSINGEPFMTEKKNLGGLGEWSAGHLVFGGGKKQFGRIEKYFHGVVISPCVGWRFRMVFLYRLYHETGFSPPASVYGQAIHHNENHRCERRQGDKTEPIRQRVPATDGPGEPHP